MVSMSENKIDNSPTVLRYPFKVVLATKFSQMFELKTAKNEFSSV